MPQTFRSIVGASSRSPQGRWWRWLERVAMLIGRRVAQARRRG